MTDLGVYGDRFAESGLRVFEHAVEESRRRRQNYVSLGHILKALAVEDAVSFTNSVSELRIAQPLTEELLEKVVEGAPDWMGRGIRLSPQVISLLRRAMGVARANERGKIEAADLLSAFVQSVKVGAMSAFLRISPPHSLVVRA